MLPQGRTSANVVSHKPVEEQSDRNLVFNGSRPIMHVVAISQNIQHLPVPLQVDVVLFLRL